MERKLASIQKIVDIQPIEGADNIVCAQVLGWKCVTQKSNNFKPGDLVVYFEIDSLIPFEPWSEFLFKNGRTGNHRLKTIRLRGQVSQGLILPIESLGRYFAKKIVKDGRDYYKKLIEVAEEGMDISEELKITKYEPEIPAQLQGICKSTFPSWIPKTDETRIQSMPHILEDLKGEIFVATEKLDGSSMTVYLKDGEFGVCSRNMDLKESETNSYWITARKLDLENKLKSLGKNIALQGELVGPGVQKNKLGLKELQYRIFNVYDIDEAEYYSEPRMAGIIIGFGLQTVPLLPSFEMRYNVDQLIEMSIGPSLLNSQVQREGLVFRPLRKMIHPKYGRMSFKAINPEFLLKYGE